ncbi:MAG: hypothetical protein HY698_19095 [Deltaproteobacteria bacterium]|nr:hypothetical protein [Deltaproteobacteria bacterium]
MSRLPIARLSIPVFLFNSILTGTQASASDSEAPPENAPTGDPVVQAAPPPADKWEIAHFGVVRAGYDSVSEDSRYDFIGRNNGFALHNARIGLFGGNAAHRLSYELSIEGAVDYQEHVNTPQGELDVRLREAYVRYDPVPWAGLQLGQFKAPLAGEELRDYRDLMFPSRAVAQEGIPVGRGFQERGIAVDRQVGLMLSPSLPIFLGPFGVRYYGMIMNGNGANQLLDDNGKPGLVARVELLHGRNVKIGGAVLKNERTVGQLPNLYTEKDTGFAADAEVRFRGLHAFGQLAKVKTSFPTVGADDRTQEGFHVEVGYRLQLGPLPLTPAYRFARFHPWAGAFNPANGVNYDAFRLDYHTLGLRIEHSRLPMSGYLAYTITSEPEPRDLKNNYLQVLGQVIW